jgi:DNA-binding Xre family transcriptional regulator
MNEHNRDEDRDKVLFAFHQECERPTAEQILDWIARFPQYAEDIRAHAAVSRDWAAREGRPSVEASEALLARGHSNALNALYNSDMKALQSKNQSSAQSLHEIAGARGKQVFELAAEIDIGRGVVADLFNGLMKPPIRQRLVDAICATLQIGRETFDSAMAYGLLHPRLGYAKANSMPTVTARSCDDIIRDSNMSEDRKRFWLEEV